jgi:hypothetical protein
LGKIPEKEVFMKRTVLFIISLIIAGMFAYYAGYYVYKMNRPEVKFLETESVQRAVQLPENKQMVSDEYYIGIIEQNMLAIYKMPEEILYDSIDVESLQFYGNEKKQLTEGMIFKNLTEVYEFLENSMS